MNQANRQHLQKNIVVWLAKVSQSADLLNSADYLGSQELERADRFRFPEDRSRFILGRVLVRKTLHREFGYPLSKLHLGYTGEKKPFLINQPDICFSISHSADFVALALALETSVGVDLEFAGRAIQVQALAKEIFSPTDLSTFNALSADAAIPAFFRAWTGKEAYLKARGTGIVGGMKEVSVKLSPTTEPYVITGHEDWKLQALPLSEGYLGHVAWDDSRKRLDVRFLCRPS